jgi:DNA polymerase family A
VDPQGADPLADRHDRGLTDETIQAARLGWTPWVTIPKADGTTFKALGVVIPWFASGRLTLLKIRQPDGRRPKYVEAFRDPARLTISPGPDLIRPGRPLVIVEGELDALLLSQVLSELAAVVTQGSASSRPGPGILGALLPADPWYVATDADEAGDQAAAGWPARARRVRPSLKDWGEMFQAGINLHDLWREALARETFLARLQARGLRLDGRLVHPQLTVGTVTGRVVYTGPGLQTLPEGDRLAKLAPVVPGRVFVRADFGQIEPRIMLAVLRRQGLLTWDIGPDEDVYLVLAGDADDRDTAKTAINRIINGGRPDAPLSGRLTEFIRAADAYRAELAKEAKFKGFVRTLAGRVIPLAADEDNHGGKAVNRVVQGTAADIFNRSALRIDEALQRTGGGAVAFLLYDEIWVECEPAHVRAVASLVQSEMTTAGLELGINIPVCIEPDPGPPRYTWEQLARWRWGPARADPEGGIVIDRPDPARMLAALKAAARADDPYPVAERLAIRAET